MTRPVLTFVRAGLMPAAFLCLCTTSGHAAGMQGDANTPDRYSMVPSSPSDHFVPGKYNNSTGAYIPPHYQAVAKPPFHGYFFRKNTPGYDGMNSETTNKNRLDDPGTLGASKP